MIMILHTKLSDFSLTRSILCFVSAFMVNAVLASYWCHYFDFGIPTERFSQCGNGVDTPFWIGLLPLIFLAVAVYPMACKLMPLVRSSNNE